MTSQATVLIHEGTEALFQWHATSNQNEAAFVISFHMVLELSRPMSSAALHRDFTKYGILMNESFIVP